MVFIGFWEDAMKSLLSIPIIFMSVSLYAVNPNEAGVGLGYSADQTNLNINNNEKGPEKKEKQENESTQGIKKTTSQRTTSHGNINHNRRSFEKNRLTLSNSAVVDHQKKKPEMSDELQEALNKKIDSTKEFESSLKKKNDLFVKYFTMRRTETDYELLKLQAKKESGDFHNYEILEKILEQLTVSNKNFDELSYQYEELSCQGEKISENK